MRRCWAPAVASDNGAKKTAVTLSGWHQGVMLVSGLPRRRSLSEEVYLMGLWRHLTTEEAAYPSPAREWLARCDPTLSPDQAYCQYHEISIEDRWAPFSFGNAWSASHRDHPTIKRAICQMPLPKLEGMVLIG